MRDPSVRLCLAHFDSSGAGGALLGQGFAERVTIRLPRGGRATFALAECGLAADAASAAVVKDAGDDPDVTHGCLVRAEVRAGVPGTGVTFRAGEGVGTVTRPGVWPLRKKRASRRASASSALTGNAW